MNTTSPSDWLSFWRDDRDSGKLVMEVSTLVAAERFHRHFNILPGQSVLDFGCGPGVLTAYLKERGIEALGVDLNKAQIDENRRRFPNVLFANLQVGDPAVSLSGAPTDKFDYVILLSVVQYLDSITTLSKLVKDLSVYLRGGGKLILADVVDKQTDRRRDAWAALQHCIALGRPKTFLRFVIFLTRMYLSTKGAPQLLLVEEGDLRVIAVDNGLVLTNNGSALTIHPTRKSYTFTKLNA